MYGIIKKTIGLPDKSSKMRKAYEVSVRYSIISEIKSKGLIIKQKEFFKTDNICVLIFLIEGKKKRMYLPEYEAVFNDLDSAELAFELL